MFVGCPAVFNTQVSIRPNSVSRGWRRLRSLESAISRRDQGGRRGVSSESSAKRAFGRSQTLKNNVCASPPNSGKGMDAKMGQTSDPSPVPLRLVKAPERDTLSPKGECWFSGVTVSAGSAPLLRPPVIPKLETEEGPEYFPVVSPLAPMFSEKPAHKRDVEQPLAP